MDKLEITALSVSTIIGVHAFEQRIQQRLLLDISLGCNAAHCQDDLARTIDYDALCQHVTEYVESNAFALIETVAEQVAQLIKDRFAVTDITVRVSKPHAIKNAGNIAITVVR